MPFDDPSEGVVGEVGRRGLPKCPDGRGPGTTIEQADLTDRVAPAALTQQLFAPSGVPNDLDPTGEQHVHAVGLLALADEFDPPVEHLDGHLDGELTSEHLIVEHLSEHASGTRPVDATPSLGQQLGHLVGVLLERAEHGGPGEHGDDGRSVGGEGRRAMAAHEGGDLTDQGARPMTTHHERTPTGAVVPTEPGLDDTRDHHERLGARITLPAQHLAVVELPQHGSSADEGQHPVAGEAGLHRVEVGRSSRLVAGHLVAGHRCSCRHGSGRPSAVPTHGLLPS